MSIFKEKNFVERRGSAASAKAVALEKYRAKLAEVDPLAEERSAQRIAQAQAREARKAEREAEKAAREAAKAAEKERLAAEREAEEIAKAEAVIAEAAAQKAARDRRYALRKAGRK